MRKLLLFIYACFYLSQLSAQLSALEAIEQLAPTATTKERIARRDEMTSAFQQATDIQEKLALAKAYEEVAVSKQDSILLSHSYDQLQEIYLVMGDLPRHQLYIGKQKEIEGAFGFLLSDLNNNYQFLYNHLKVFTEGDVRLRIEEAIAKDALFKENTTADDFDPDKSYWTKLILRGDPDTLKKGLLFIEGDRTNYSWQYIDVWFVHEHGKWTHQKAGLSLKSEEKTNPSHLNFVDFQLQPNEKVIVYARVEKAEKHRANKQVGFGILQDERGNNSGYQFQNKSFPHASAFSPFHANLITSQRFYVDDTEEASFTDIAANWGSLAHTDVFTTQHVTGKVYWMKQRFVGNEQFSGEHMFYLNYYTGSDYFCFDYMDTYLVDTKGQVTHQRAGDHVSLKDRPYSFWANLIKVDISQSDTLDMYVRLEGADWRYIMPFMGLWHVDKSFWPKQINTGTREGFFYGILFIQFFYSLLLFLIGREKTYLYLSILIIGLFLTFGFVLDDSLHFVPFPTYKEWHIPLAFIGQFLIGYGILKFTAAYFAYPKESVFVKYIIPAFLLTLGSLTASVIYEMELRDSDFYFNSEMVLLMMVIGTVWWMGYWAKSESAISKKFYFIAFAPVGVAFLLFAINFLGPRIFGVVGLNLIDISMAYFLLKMAIVVMLIMLALSTGHRTNQLKTEKAFVLQQTLVDQQQVNQSISRFVPNEFLQALGKTNITQITLGDHIEKIVTVFFADIRGYTTLAERMTPQENFIFVNAFNGRLGPIIQKNNGFVNQYLGDGIMAIFSKSVADSLRSAVQMQQTLQAYNRERVAKERPPIKVGMGMHTGALIMGIIGDANRMDPATISDVVNTASRIENLTKFYGASILLSEISRNNIPSTEAFHFRYLGQVQVKGKQQSIKIYECYDGDIPSVFKLKQQTQTTFELGIQHYFNKRFSEAALVLEEVIQQNSEDLPAKLYLEKAKDLAEKGVSEYWTGVETMLFK